MLHVDDVMQQGHIVIVVVSVVVASCAACGGNCTRPRPAAILEDVGVTVDRAVNRFTPAMVSVTFDDAGKGQDLAADDLEARRMRGTFYFTSGFIDRPANLTTDEARRVVAGGHEVGDHTITHPNLRTLDDFSLYHELFSSRDELDDVLCIADIKSFAPPFGDTNANVTAFVKSGYASQRTVRRGINLPDADVYALKSNALNTGAQRFVGETPATVHDLLAQAIDAGGWVILHFHQIVESDPVLHIQYPRSQYDDILDDIAQAREDDDVAVVTVAQGLALMGEPSRSR